MSIPPNSPWRGCAAKFSQPVSDEDEQAAKSLVENVYSFNCGVASPPLADIVYRSSSQEQDILQPVFRWDLTSYEEVFQNGFQATPQQEDTPDEIYYNLDHYYAHHGGSRPLDSDRPSSAHAFISTTITGGWYPNLSSSPAGTEIDMYRYEIYAPGGIWVAQTLGDRYQYSAQDEVCFVAGIAPQYIRSAQRFMLIADNGNTRRERADNLIRISGYFNPQQHPRRLINIQRPVFDCLDENGTRVSLGINIYLPDRSEDERGQIIEDSNATDWYAYEVANIETYVNAAFCSSRKNEAYIFIRDEYLLLNYAPGTTDDWVVNGPLRICDGYPFLVGTTFGEYGIDCAFRSHDKNEAFIFSGNLCARIDYGPGTTNGDIVVGPMTITAMFPFFKRTVFESGIDSAFEGAKAYEAYLFKGNQHAHINYGPKPHIIATCPITQRFASLKNTVFESGIDAAFASHRTYEAYLFRGDSYVLIDYAPFTTDDYVIGGVKKILPNWPSLRSILPRKNRGLDVHLMPPLLSQIESQGSPPLPSPTLNCCCWNILCKKKYKKNSKTDYDGQ